MADYRGVDVAESISWVIKPSHYAEKRAKTHILYRCYDSAKVLLYVGITNNPEQRFVQHSQIQEWWHKVDHIRLQRLPNRPSLERAEKAAVQLEKPLYNIALVAPNSEAARNSTLPTARKFGKGRGFQLFPEANHFGTREPQDGHLIDMTREQMLYPCSECKVRGIYCEGDTVACRMCGYEWTYDDWFAMTFCNVDQFGQYRLI